MPRRIGIALVAPGAALTWLVLLLAEGRHLAYYYDDVTVLGPLFDGGLRASLEQYLRPLEYGIAKLSAIAGWPLWLYASGLVYVATAGVAYTLLKRLRPSAPPAIAMPASFASPLLAQTYFQIDTVSQALGNLFALSLALATLSHLAAPTRARTTAVIVLAALALLSKETTYGVVLLSGLALAVLSPSSPGPWRRLLYATPILLTLCAVAWRLQVVDTDLSGHYDLHLNPLVWLFHATYMVGVAIFPYPSSLLFTGYVLNAPKAAIAAAAVVAAATATAAIVALRTWRRHALEGRSLPQAIQSNPATSLTALFALSVLFPTALIQGSELYASALTPLLMVLTVVALLSTLRTRAAFVIVALLCTGQIASSWFNLGLFRYATQAAYIGETSVSAARNYRDILVRHDGHLREYSLYWPVGRDPERYESRGGCLRDTALPPGVCLPSTITEPPPRLLSSTSSR